LINKLAQLRAWLLLGWVTACRNHNQSPIRAITRPEVVQVGCVNHILAYLLGLRQSDFTCELTPGIFDSCGVVVKVMVTVAAWCNS